MVNSNSAGSSSGRTVILRAATVSEAVNGGAGFAVGSFRAGRAVARFFGAQRLRVRNIFLCDELVHRHRCDNEFAAAKCVRVGSAGGKLLKPSGIEFASFVNAVRRKR